MEGDIETFTEHENLNKQNRKMKDKEAYKTITLLTLQHIGNDDSH
jgi:hypothetical protein